MGIVPNARCACGFIFRKFYGRRYVKIVDAVCGNPEAEIGIKRICNSFSISIININTSIWFASTLVMLNLDDFPGLACTDGEITILPHVLPLLFLQRNSICDCVVAQLGENLVANAQCLYTLRTRRYNRQIIGARF